MAQSERPLLVTVCLLAGGIVLSNSARADPKLEGADPAGDLSTVEQQLGLSATAQRQIADEMAEVQKDRDAISTKLAVIARTVQEQQREIAAAEAAIPNLTKREVLIRADLAAKNEDLSALLAGLQRLEMNPPPALVVQPKDVLASLRGAMMFGAVVPEMRGEARMLADKLAELHTLRQQVEDKRRTIAENITNLKGSEHEMAALMAAKKALLTSGSEQLANERKKATALASKAQDLQQLIAQLKAERLRAEAEQQRKLKVEEAERLRQAELAARPRIAFAEAQGRLPYPVAGDIIGRFGDSDGLGAKLSGLAIATGAASQVITPADGKVEFSGPFRSYGQLLIIDAGQGYLLLLAGMDKINVEPGQIIRAGEPVGVMGSGPSSVTLLGDKVHEPRPVLYVELRKDGTVMDSVTWWLGGRKEAVR